MTVMGQLLFHRRMGTSIWAVWESLLMPLWSLRVQHYQHPCCLAPTLSLATNLCWQFQAHSWHPHFLLHSVTAPKRGTSFSLKVVKATVCRQGKRKAEFQPISQTYLELVESTASLEHILGIIQKRWGGWIYPCHQWWASTGGFASNSRFAQCYQR